MSYQKEREEFIQAFGREFPNAPHSVCLAMLRNASAEQRYNEICSSIEVSDREARRLDKASERRTERMRELCRSIGAELVENGDPRGYSYLIRVPSGRTTDWGNRGIGIPGRGLPASAFR